jgi:type IV pilus assembly protein PilW
MTRRRTAIPWWPTLTESTASAMRPRRKPSGFSLIEVLISMVLALITFLVMFQMFESWDRSRRSTASGGSAMVTGAMAMFRIERDLRLAGFGFGNATDLGCTVSVYDTARPDDAAAGAVSATVSNVFTFPLVALQIVNGNTDQIVTTYGSSEGISTTRFFGTSAAGAQPYTALTANSATMEIGARGGIQQGDLVVIAQDSGACNLVEVTDTSSSDRRTLSFTGGNFTHFYTAAVNTAPRYNDPGGLAASGATGRVYVLGPGPQRRVWQIRNSRTLAYTNDFRWTDTTNNTTGAATADGANDFTDIADNIVNLQAEYGVATPAGSPAAPTCTPVNNPTWTSVAPVTACQPFVWAVRVALLARSDQFEKAAITATAPTWAGGGFTMTNLDGSAGNTVPTDPAQDWRHYRYKVFESIVPLKNVMWGSR